MVHIGPYVTGKWRNVFVAWQRFLRKNMNAHWRWMFGLCFGLLPACIDTSGWISTPGTLRNCEGDNVTFTWQFDFPEKFNLIYLTNYETEILILKFDLQTSTLKEYDAYIGRTAVPYHSANRISITLVNVTKKDAGVYKLELGRIRKWSLAKLRVYDIQNDLEPSVLINNEPRSEKITITDPVDEVLLTVRTNADLPANVSIKGEDLNKTNCTSSGPCRCVVRKGDIDRLTVTVDYGMCDTLEITSVISWQPNGDRRRRIKIALGITFPAYGIAAAIFLIRFRNKLKCGSVPMKTQSKKALSSASLPNSIENSPLLNESIPSVPKETMEMTKVRSQSAADLAGEHPVEAEVHAGFGSSSSVFVSCESLTISNSRGHQ